MFSLEYAIVHACNYTKKLYFYFHASTFAWWLSGKFSLPRELVPDIGKMLEKIKTPGSSEKFPDP